MTMHCISLLLNEIHADILQHPCTEQVSWKDSTTSMKQYVHYWEMISGSAVKSILYKSTHPQNCYLVLHNPEMVCALLCVIPVDTNKTCQSKLIKCIKMANCAITTNYIHVYTMRMNIKYNSKDAIKQHCLECEQSRDYLNV